MADTIRIRTSLEKYPHEFRIPRRRRLVQRSVASGLRHVHICSLGDQNAGGLAILAQSDAGVQRLVVLGVAGEAMDMRPVDEQQSRCGRPAKGSRKMQEAPIRQANTGEPAWHPAAAATQCGRNPPERTPRKYPGWGGVAAENPNQRLPAVNAPQKSRDALGVSASN